MVKKTESLAATRYQVDDRLEKAMREYEGAVALRKMLEDKNGRPRPDSKE